MFHQEESDVVVVSPRSVLVTVETNESMEKRGQSRNQIMCHAEAIEAMVKDDASSPQSQRRVSFSMRQSSQNNGQGATSATAPPTAATTNTVTLVADYSKYERPSKLRTSVLTSMGILLMVGGIVWAIVHVIEFPDYVTTTTGQPTGAVLCSQIEQDLMTQLQLFQDTTASHHHHNNSNTDLALYAAHYQEQCQVLPEIELPCTLAVSYTFTTNSSSNQVEIGFAAFQFDLGHDCDETVDASRQAFLHSTNLTIYYNDKYPSDNYYQPPPNPYAVAGIIAGIGFAVGILFLCVSLLEQILV
jgi:hypothetical protein